MSARPWGAVALPLGVGLALFAPLLLAGDGRVLGVAGYDLDGQFVHWRAFGFGRLCRGDLPLWNPHLFSGMPYLASFQSALLYPPNLIFCALPLDRALNASLGLHVLVAGTTTALWLARRGLAPVACGVGGVVYMLSGGFFLHLYPGHLPNVCTMAWIPLLLCAIDAVAAEGLRPRPLALGTLAVSLQILAGHPQYVYYAALAAGVYALVRPLAGPTTRARLVAAGALMYAGAALLTAAQLLPGLVAARAGVRGGGAPYAFAASLAFPPENLATLLAWDVLGPIDAYAGRGLLWEASLFVGVAGTALAAIGWVHLDRAWRRALGVVLAALLVLALGDRTPVFAILYHVLPGFGTFRGTTKFAVLIGLFVVLAAATGADALVRRPRWDRAGVVLLAGGLVMLALVAALGRDGVRAEAWAARYLQRVAASGEAIALAPPPAATPAVAAATAARALGRTAVLAIALGGLLCATRRVPAARLLVLVVAVGEMLQFARAHMPTFPIAAAYPAQLGPLRERTREGDARVLNALAPNLAMSWGYLDLWGHDPGVSRRYAEFLTWVHGGDPDAATQYLPPAYPHPAIALLRGRFGVFASTGEVRRITVASPLPRVQVVHAHRVLPTRDAIFAVLGEGFDATREALLEVEPHPPPEPATGPEWARVVRESTDEVEVDVRLAASGIVVLSDAYDPGWRARLLGPEAAEVPVLACNRVLRAVALPAGHHRLLFEYRPGAFVVGAWVSAATLGAGLAAAILVRRRAGRPGAARAAGRTVAAMVCLFAALQALLPALVPANRGYENAGWYFDVARQMREHGLLRVWTPYPPLFSPLLLAVTAGATRETFLVRWKILNVALVLAIALVLHGMLRPHGRRRAALAALGWVLVNASWTSAVSIGLFIDQFEYVPILVLLLALHAAQRGRDGLSAVLCAAGTMTKLFPAAAAVAGLLVLPGARRLRFAATFLLACVAVAAPFLLGEAAPLRSWYEFTASRDAWETVWQYPRISFPPVPFPAHLAQPFRSGARPYAALSMILAASVLAYGIWHWRRPGRAALAEHALCVLLLLLLFSKGISSYFVLWVFPLLFLCYAPLAAFALCAALLLVANLEFVAGAYWVSLWARHALLAGVLVHRLAVQAGGLPPAPALGGRCDARGAVEGS